MTTFNTKQTTLIQHLVSSSVNSENADVKTRMMLQGLGNIYKQAKNARLIFARSPHGWAFSTPQRKQVVKRSYQRAFATVNDGFTLSNKGEIEIRTVRGDVTRVTTETVPVEQLKASQDATLKANNSLASAIKANKKQTNEHKKEMKAVEQTAADLTAELEIKNAELTARNAELETALNKLTRENHEATTTIKNYREAINSTVTRVELKEMVNA